MLDLATLATVFAVVFVGELPDKTAVATVVLGARYRAVPVLAGVGAAFALHVAVAVAAGALVAELPRRPIAAGTGLLFVAGAVLLLRSDPQAAAREGEREAEGVGGTRTLTRTALGTFGVVLVAEFGDLTQVLTATLAARYRDPLAVGLGAVLALWAVAALAVLLGRGLLQRVPLRRVQAAAGVLLVLGALALLDAVA